MGVLQSSSLETTTAKTHFSAYHCFCNISQRGSSSVNSKRAHMPLQMSFNYAIITSMALCIIQKQSLQWVVNGFTIKCNDTTAHVTLQNQGVDLILYAIRKRKL